jgi:hypothetical protein
MGLAIWLAHAQGARPGSFPAFVRLAHPPAEPDQRLTGTRAVRGSLDVSQNREERDVFM